MAQGRVPRSRVGDEAGLSEPVPHHPTQTGTRGFGPLWTAKVIEAIDHSVPVGSVGYGPESIDAMHALFSD